MDKEPPRRNLHVVGPDEALPDDFIPGWYACISSRELRDGHPVALERFARRWVVFRHDGGVSVLEDRCPHRGAALSAGHQAGNRIVCPFHGFEFGADGVCVHIPAHGQGGHIPGAMRTSCLPAREAHGFVWLWWGDEPDELPAIDWFTSELEGCAAPSEFWRDAQVGLSRNIENQLDFTHLPFVHATSIGRFIESPKMEIDVEVDGQRLRAFQRGRPESFVELRLPNIWIIRTGPQTYGTIAFAPIDRERTRLYLRSYQSRVRVPVLRDIVGWIMSQSNKWIIGQDLRVIEGHQPKVSPHLDGTEVLIPSDAPIIAYRKIRDQAR